MYLVFHRILDFKTGLDFHLGPFFIWFIHSFIYFTTALFFFSIGFRIFSEIDHHKIPITNYFFKIALMIIFHTQKNHLCNLRSKTLLRSITVVLFIISCSKKGSGSSGNGSGSGNTTLRVDSISPTSGTAGTLVTIYGTGFSGSTAGDALTVNGVSVTPVDGKTQMISFTVPTGWFPAQWQ
jgi:hypothetical protein